MVIVKPWILKEQKGILAPTEFHTGRQISSEVKDLVQQFYCDDNYSRQMPAKKYYVSIGKEVHMSKKLIF